MLFGEWREADEAATELLHALQALCDDEVQVMVCYGHNEPWSIEITFKAPAR